MFSKPPVVASEDYRRVRALPVRDPDTYYPKDLVEKMSAALRVPGSKALLREVQARALYDLARGKKGFYPIRVGGGKTLISFLAPRVLGSSRCLLVTKAALLEKTDREWRKAKEDWQVARHLQFRSYEKLGRVSGATDLEMMKPDLIIADEAHCLKNPRAAVTRRFARYMATHPNTRFIPMTGTLMKNSVKDFAHLMAWAMRETSVLPGDKGELEAWAGALDEGLNPVSRRSPGVLLDLMRIPDDGSDDDDNSRRARKVFFARANATEGIIVADAQDDYQGSLLIEGIEYEPNAATEKNFQILRDTMCKPDGWALGDAMQVWAEARRLAVGVHYAWDPAPPEAWLQARKLWAACVRDTLKSPRADALGWDSELQVTTAVLSGQLEDEYGLLADWQAIKPTFTIDPKPVWHDDTALNLCAKWLTERPRGICWVEHRFFGFQLAKNTGLPYFGPKGLDAKGNFIEDADGPIIASVAANSNGRNLQFKWCDNLVTAPPADSERWEQMMARTHRYKQPADSVSVDVLIGCREHLESIPRALASADVKSDLLGFSQRLKISDIVWPEDSSTRRGPRWA